MATAKAEEHASLPDLPTGDQGIAAGSYKVEHDEDLSVLAKDAAIAAKLWFKSPVSVQPVAVPTLAVANIV